MKIHSEIRFMNSHDGILTKLNIKYHIFMISSLSNPTTSEICKDSIVFKTLILKNVEFEVIWKLT